jgi:hypothetical protein
VISVMASRSIAWSEASPDMTNDGL